MHAFLVLALAYLILLAAWRKIAVGTGRFRGSLRYRLGLVARNFASDLGELDVSPAPAVAELRTALAEQGNTLRELRTKPADQRGDTYADDVRRAIDTIHQLDGELLAAERSATPAPRGPAAAFEETGRDQYRTAGEEFVNSAIYTEARGHNRFNAGYVEAEIRGSLHEQRTLLGGGSVAFTIGDDGGAWRPLGTPIPPQVRQQRLFIRDVLNVIPTGLGAVPYIKELNAAANETGATAVAEGAAKPEVTIEFQPALAPVVKIAAWVPVTEEILEDAPTLAGYINTRLSYMLDLREENQVLNGPGTGPNMSGIRQASGIQTQASVANDLPAVIGLAIGKIENVDGEATFAAINPLNFWTAVTTRHANQFDNGFGVSAPAQMAGITWGLDAIRTRSMESGKALVGSRMGATIADRMSTVIRIGNQHSTYFTENKVAVLAERREALLIHRDDFFVLCDVPTS